jgi:hypothetical protein
MNNLKANFFIIGAPKCGTTALSNYLKKNPKIFITTPKEPNFFSDDFPGLRYVHSLNDYESLYNLKRNKYSAVGEASPIYIMSQVAAKKIHAYNSDAKIIVMLRNPMDMLISYHFQLVHSLFEDQITIEEAWRLQGERSNGRCIPQHCREPKLLQYREIINFGDHLERLYQIFPREQVLVIFHEEMKISTEQIYLKTLNYLGVPHDGQNQFPVHNIAKTARWKWLNQQLHAPPPWAKKLMGRVSGTSFHDMIVGIHHRINTFNSESKRPDIPSPKFKAEIAEILYPQVEKLSGILNIDLNHWSATLKS